MALIVKHTPSDSQDRALARYSGAIWRWLTEPGPTIMGVERRHKARLLASLLVLFIPIATLGLIIQSRINLDYEPIFSAPVSGLVVLALAYGLNRSGRYMPGAVLTTFAPSMVSLWGLFIPINDPVSFGFLLVSVIFASMLLPAWGVVAIGVFNAIGLSMLALIVPAWPLSALLGQILVQFWVPSLVLVGIRHRDSIEKDRQAELHLAYDTTLEGWARAVELRNRDLAGHSQRVMEITVQLAPALGVEVIELEHIRRGALLHDIGKIGISDNILLHPGPLNREMRAVVEQHPKIAYDLLYRIQFLRPAIDIPLFHHEKWDGSGYPYGLAGEDIPLSARIFAIADVWDALQSNRPYREAWGSEKALNYIKEQKGHHFDPQVVDQFLLMIREDSFVIF